MPFRVELDIDDSRWGALIETEAFVSRVLACAAKAEKMSGEVSVILSTDALLQSLNAQWRGHDKPTNILSFPADRRAKPLLGDLALAFETIQREANEQNKTLAEHTAHMLVHGLLHLLGYDHLEDAEAQRMEARERAILLELSIADPYASHD